MSDSSCSVLQDLDEEYHIESIDYIWYAVGINCGQLTIFIGLLLLVLTYLPRARRALAPKWRGSDHASVREYLVELWPYQAKDSELSPDALVIVRLCDMGCWYSVLATSFVGCFLVPVYASGSAKHAGFVQYTILNIGAKDYWRSWISLLGGAGQVLIALYLLHGEWRHFVEMRQRHLRRRAEGQLGAGPAQAQYSVMVENLPEEACKEPAVKQLFEEVLGPVHSVIVQKDTQALHRWMAQTAKRRLCGCIPFGSRLDHTNYRHKTTDQNLEGQQSGLKNAAKEAMRMEEKMQDLMYSALHDEKSSTAFVTLTKATSRVIAEQVILFSSVRRKTVQLTSDVCHVRAAPESCDIFWHNAAIPYFELRRRRWAGLAMCGIGFFFWTSAVVTIQALASIEEWNIKDDTVNGALDSPAGHLFVGYLPVIALLLLLYVLPYILALVGDRVEGQKQKSVLQRQVLFRTLGFHVATLWTTVFSANISRTLVDLGNHPSCLPEVLGKALPGQAAYFVIFVIAKMGTSIPLLIAGPLIRIPWPRGDKAPDPIHCSLASEVTQLAIVFILSLMYASISPLILPASAVFFIMSGFVYRWLFHNVYEPEFDCTGLFWYELVDFFMAALLLAPISLAGIYATFYRPLAFQLQIIWLLPIGIAFLYVAWYRLYQPLASVVAYQDACAMDRNDSQRMCVIETFSDDYYLDPAMQENASGPVQPGMFGGIVAQVVGRRSDVPAQQGVSPQTKDVLRGESDANHNFTKAAPVVTGVLVSKATSSTPPNEAGSCSATAQAASPAAKGKMHVDHTPPPAEPAASHVQYLCMPAAAPALAGGSIDLD